MSSFKDKTTKIHLRKNRLSTLKNRNKKIKQKNKNASGARWLSLGVELYRTFMEEIIQMLHSYFQKLETRK